MKIGIISDTHGIFREEWHRHLDGCDYLIHAGDFCTQKNYDCFRNFGIPLYMVRGNNDRGDWAKNLPEFLQFRIGGKTFFLVHNQFDLPFDQMLIFLSLVILITIHFMNVSIKFILIQAVPVTDVEIRKVLQS